MRMIWVKVFKLFTWDIDVDKLLLFLLLLNEWFDEVDVVNDAVELCKLLLPFDFNWFIVLYN